MTSSRKVKKKAIKRVSRKPRLQSGRFSEKLIFIVVAAFILIGVGLFFWKPWESLTLPFASSKVAVVKPNMDMARARQMMIDPEKDSVMQIITHEKVRITLEIPKGALKEKTLVKLIPFYHDKKSAAPTAGVIVGPASVNFEVPVTLSFNFTESDYKNLAPKTAVEKTLRKTGLSQVLQVDSKATSLTPTLIARGLETETYLPSRILTGGAYVFSLDGKQQTQIARKALASEGMHTLTIMESATALLFQNQRLSTTEEKKTKAAVAKILAKKTPPPLELYAALILQKKITNPSFSLIQKAYAYETGEGYFQAACRSNDLTVEQYLGLAQSAQLMGHDNIGQSCLNKAKNKVAEDAAKVLAGNPDVKTVMVTLQNVQLVGLDGETNLEERLIEKAKEVTTEAAKKVADDPNSSAVEAAIEMQKMEAVGADNGPTYDALKQKVEDFVNKQEAKIDEASGQYQNDEAAREAAYERLADEAEKEEERLREEYENEAIQQEEILMNAAMSQLGIGMLKLFGFDELDEQSVKEKFDKMQEEAKMMLEASYEFCVGMRAEGIDAGDCEGQRSHAEGLLKEAEAASYRATSELGKLQSQAFETPEYTDENGDFELYFEEDLTPTPEEGEDDMGEYESGFESEDESYDDSYDESYEDPYYDYGPDGQSTEDDDYSAEEDSSGIEYSSEE